MDLALKCEKHFSTPLQPHLIALCPTIDLVAVILAETQLEVLRFSGQRAFSLKRHSSSDKIEGLVWQPDGTHIALAWSDGIVEIVDVELGKVAHQFTIKSSNIKDSTTKTISSISWTSNVIDTALVNGPGIENFNGHTKEQSDQPGSASIEDWARDFGSDIDAFNEIPNDLADQDYSAHKDLPRHLALIDIEADLPKLSPLPHIDDKAIFETPDDKFTTQIGVDACFPVFTDDLLCSSTVDTTLACCADGSVTAILASSFIAGQYKIIEPTDSPHRQCSIVATDSLCNKHVLLSQRSRDQSSKQASSDTTNIVDLSIDVLTFNDIPQTSYYLPFVIQKIKSLHHISDYIAHTVVTIGQAWFTAQDLPSRFISNVRGSLSSEDEATVDLDAALYHLAVTGDCHAVVKEWLVDELGERGHQRWDTAITTGYNHVLTLVHSHLLPALERCTVLASRLRSLSRNPDIPLLPQSTTREFTRLVQDLSILTLIAHNILNYASAELRQFHVFSSWLSAQITNFSAEPESTTAQEAEEKASSVDFTLLLPYIQDTLLSKSSLNFFLSPSRSSLSILEQPRRPQLQVRWAILLQILERHRRECVQPSGEKVELVNILHQALFIRDTIQTLCQSVPETFIKATEIERDIQVCSNVKDGAFDIFVQDDKVWIATVPSDKHENLVVHEIELGNFQSRAHKPETQLPAFSKPGNIISICFVSRSEILLLLHEATCSQLLYINSDKLTEWRKLRTWSHNEGDYRPGRVEVRNMRGTQKNTAKLVLIADADGKGWQVFDLALLMEDVSA